MRIIPRFSQVPKARFALAMLVIASLSCGLPQRREQTEPTQAFATATPGGKISVSLLTPTAGNDPALATLNPDQTTPIGPVATATAFARAASAATATADALNSRVYLPPATCPAQGSPAVPSQPATFEQYPEVLIEYLSLGGPPTVLEATLRGWGAITNLGGLVRADRDFTADGVPEVLLLLLNPGSTRVPPGGDIFVFGCEDAVYRLLYRAGYTPERSAPVIVSADDLIGIGYNHLVYVTETCDVSSNCQKQAHAVGWNITLGTFSEMSNAPIVIPGSLSQELGVLVTDTTNDGNPEIIVNSGTATSPEAGPGRPLTQIWAWTGQNFALSQTITTDAEFRIHVIHDADDALARGDFETATALYLRVIGNEDLQSWTLPNEASYLRAYAFYKLMVTHAVQYDQTEAGDYFDELVASYPPDPSFVGEDNEDGEPPPEANGPGSIYAELAIAFWDTFIAQNDHGVACQTASLFAQNHPETLSPLNSFGSANRKYTPTDMCPFVAQ